MKNKEYIASQLDDIIKALNNIKNSIMESEENDTVTEGVKNGDVPIGETFEFEGKEYIVKECSDIEYERIRKGNIESICDLCAFGKSDCTPCYQLCCAWFERRDEIDAYFVEKNKEK